MKKSLRNKLLLFLIISGGIAILLDTIKMIVVKDITILPRIIKMVLIILIGVIISVPGEKSLGEKNRL